MRKLVLAFFTCALSLVASSQYWQQHVNYVIDVTLNDKEKTLDAFEKITYTNNSPDTLQYIWFHLWPNAYKNDRTAFSDQLLINGNTNFYFSNPEQKGYINRLDFKVNGITAITEDHPEYIDVIKLILPKPLLPEQQITITTPFHEKLPFNFSRGGYDGESFQVTQWYPKPAVYDKNGWHPMPYLDQGEFYSEFGSFDVRITVPKNYVVAATGRLQNEDEKKWMDQRKFIPANKKRVIKTSTSLKKIKAPNSSIETKTLQYKQDSIHDFAWFANKDFIVDHDTCQLPSGKIIEVYSYYTKQQMPLWKNSVHYAKDAVRFYSKEVGEYPFNMVSVVQGPQSFGGGMEYPMITIIAPTVTAKDLDVTIAHEIGHNWFYAVLATNERDHPWMDEGINSFYEYKYTQQKYGKQNQVLEILFQTKALRRTDQPIETTSENFSENNYNLVAYHKTADWMQLLESKMGEDRFRNMMHQYFLEWQFRHPQPEDFKVILAKQVGNEEADSLFALLNTKGILPKKELTGFKFVFPFDVKTVRAYLKQPIKNTLLLSPAVGVNYYDKLMIGAGITNYKLPPNKFQYLLVPMYGTGSKRLTGLGKLNYTITSNRTIRKTDLFLNASTFSTDHFFDTANGELIMGFRKLVPGFRFTFKEKDPKSTVNKYIQWKTFLISEQSLNIRPDTVIRGVDTSLLYRYSAPWQNRYLNQLQLVYENYRVLYPFDGNLQIEQAKDFVRTAFTGNYFFNYAKGGLNLRLFAGKFFYIGEKTITKEFNNDRYFLNMTGPKGYEDYTYSDYFVGRNEFQGVSSQQIMMRDGGFKVRTDLLANKIGKTDDWLTAVNLNSTIPDKINPLSVLPIKIPLRIFLDIGTYAEAWQQNAPTGRFLYDAGFTIPLFEDALNIYIPILYSKVYGDYFKSTLGNNRFFKTISFSINLYNREFRKINRTN